MGVLRIERQDMVQVFDQFVILSRPREREEAAACLSVCLSVRIMRNVTGDNGVLSKEIKRIFLSVRSLMNTQNRMGPRTLLCSQSFVPMYLFRIFTDLRTASD